MPTVRRRFKTPTSFSFLPKRSGRVRTGEATAYDPVRQGKMAEGRRRRFDVGKTKYLAGKQTQMQKRSLASAAQRQEKRLTADKERQAAEHHRAATASTIEIVKGAKGSVSPERAQQIRQWQLSKASDGTPQGGSRQVGQMRARMAGAGVKRVARPRPQRTKAHIITGGTIGFTTPEGKSETMPANTGVQTKEQRQPYVNMAAQHRGQYGQQAITGDAAQTAQLQAEREQITTRPLWQHDLKLRNRVAQIDQDLAFMTNAAAREQRGTSGLGTTDIRNLREMAQRPIAGQEEWQGYGAYDANRQQYTPQQQQTIENFRAVSPEQRQALVSQQQAPPDPTVQAPSGSGQVLQSVIQTHFGGDQAAAMANPAQLAQVVQGSMEAQGYPPQEIAQVVQQISGGMGQQPAAPAPLGPTPTYLAGAQGVMLPEQAEARQQWLRENASWGQRLLLGGTPPQEQGPPAPTSQTMTPGAYAQLRSQAAQATQGGPVPLTIPTQQQGQRETVYAPPVGQGLPQGQREAYHSQLRAAQRAFGMETSGVPADMIQQDIAAQYGPEMAKQLMAMEGPAPQAQPPQPSPGQGMLPPQRIPVAEQAGGLKVSGEQVNSAYDLVLGMITRARGGYQGTRQPTSADLERVTGYMDALPLKVRKEAAQRLVNRLDPGKEGHLFFTNAIEQRYLRG